MHIYHTPLQLKTFRQSLSPKTKIGFVPTMGNLHQGHASLFRKSLTENDITIASIFINPTQFNQEEDFKNYPKTLEADLELLQSLGVNACFLPNTEDLYPDEYHYQVHENNLSTQLEGVHRPGHFNGVLTVVMKLLLLTQPQRAYFGEKDFQQYLLIQGMANAFFLETEIISCPTIREPSQLAFSSRNNRLSLTERLLADQFAAIFHQQHSIEKTIQKLKELNIDVEYIEEVNQRRFAAVKIGNIRLIDNFKRSED